MSKKTSAGILFIKDEHILLGHATDTPAWDIPKGGIDAGEDTKDAAIRECFEEIGFLVQPEDLIALPVMPYSDKKDVLLFLYTGKEYPNPASCICTSLFVNHLGVDTREMDDFRYVHMSDIGNYLRPHMARLVAQQYVIINIHGFNDAK